MKKNDEGRKMKAFCPFQAPNGIGTINISTCLCNNQIPQLLKGGIDLWGVGCNSSFLWLELYWKQQIFELLEIREVNPLMLGR
jgi:hypothetical protein